MPRTFVCALTLALLVPLAGCPTNDGPRRPPEDKTGEGSGVKVAPGRKHYASAKELEPLLVGKTRAEVVALLGKPQEGKIAADDCEVWRYDNRNPLWRIEDPVSGLGPDILVIVFRRTKDAVSMVSDNPVSWES
jgi:hypothetical protein